MQSRFLVCAYACSPYRGSEPGVGWGWVNMIARFGETWVLTDAANREDIERETSRDPVAIRGSPLRLRSPHALAQGRESLAAGVPVDLPALAARGLQVGCELHDKIGFSLVHVVTYVGFRVPGPFWKMDIPLVWGPIGGLENTPWRLLPAMGVCGAIHYGCRNVINTLHKLLLREPKQAFAKARGAIIAATSGIQREIERWYGEKSDVICEVGAPPAVADDYARREPGQNLRICWSGAHLPGKGLPLLLHALAKLPADASWEVCDSWRRSLHRKMETSRAAARNRRSMHVDRQSEPRGRARDDGPQSRLRYHQPQGSYLDGFARGVVARPARHLPRPLRVCRRGQRSMRNQAPGRQSACVYRATRIGNSLASCRGEHSPRDGGRRSGTIARLHVGREGVAAANDLRIETELRRGGSCDAPRSAFASIRVRLELQNGNLGQKNWTMMHVMVGT